MALSFSPQSGQVALAYIDAQAGVAGDMLLGALVGLGLEPGFFEDLGGRLGLPVRIEARSVRRSGIQGWAVGVRSLEGDAPHRHLADLEAMVLGAGLSAWAQEMALRVFRLLAEAEARVHGDSLEHVHFHEVGAADSLLDVVGVVAGLDALGLHAIEASPLPLGLGSISFSHGTHALPAPAVAELVSGLQVRGVEAGGLETVTPTGAALIKALARRQGPLPAMTVLGHGRGAGSHDRPQMANLLRIFVGEVAEQAERGPVRSDCVLVGASVDDMNPQSLPAALDQLFAAGALDVTVTPVLMKKGRPGQLIEALCAPEAERAVVAALLRHTSSIGARVVEARKHALLRREVLVETPWGEVPFKEVSWGEETLRAKPEHGVVAAVALAHGLSEEQVETAARAAYALLRRG